MATDIYQEEDGIYIGAKKKDGTFAKGARKLTAEEILTIYTTFFNDYCEEQKTDMLVMEDSNKDIIVTKRIKKE
jgi:hypothetical protein